MLALFRTNQILNSFLFLFYLFVLRGVTLLFPEYYAIANEPHGIIGEQLQYWDSLLPNWATWLIVYILLVVQAIYISAVFSKHRIIVDHILIPGATYLLVCCAVLPLHTFSPILIGNIFLIAAFDQLIVTYRNTNSSKNIFNIGFWIAIATLFYNANLIFLAAAIFSLSSLRAFKLRETFMLLSGVFVVFILVFTGFYWFDQLPYLWSVQFQSNYALLDFEQVEMVQFSAETSIVSIIILTVLFAYGFIMRKRTIQFQKKVGAMYLFLFVTAFTVFFQANLTTHHYGILTLPAGMLLGLCIKTMNVSSAEIFHLFLFIIIIIWTCSPLWLV